MLVLGLIVLLTAQALTIYGLGLGFTSPVGPVTNMFETVIFVAGRRAHGVWFTVLPLFWPG